MCLDRSVGSTLRLAGPRPGDERPDAPSRASGCRGIGAQSRPPNAADTSDASGGGAPPRLRHGGSGRRRTRPREVVVSITARSLTWRSQGDMRARRLNLEAAART